MYVFNEKSIFRILGALKIGNLRAFCSLLIDTATGHCYASTGR